KAELRLEDEDDREREEEEPEEQARGASEGAAPDPRMRLQLQAERIERLRARRDENALRLEVELKRVDRQLAPEARLLVAAERNARKRREGHVDADHARLDARRHAMAARRVARPHGREEPVAHVVRDPD